jgi:hypothetical protein
VGGSKQVEGGRNNQGEEGGRQETTHEAPGGTGVAGRRTGGHTRVGGPQRTTQQQQDKHTRVCAALSHLTHIQACPRPPPPAIHPPTPPVLNPPPPSLTMASSVLNRNAASALASSVLPTPVGPRNMKLAMGPLGSDKSARLRWMAVATAATASVCPMMRLCSSEPSWSKRSRSLLTSLATGMPVHCRGSSMRRGEEEWGE